MNMMGGMKCFSSLVPKGGGWRRTTTVFAKRRFFSSQLQAGPGQRPLSTMPHLKEQPQQHDVHVLQHFRPYDMQTNEFKFRYSQPKQQDAATRTMEASSLSLGEFIARVPSAIRARQEQEKGASVLGVDVQDPVMTLFQ